VCSFPRPGAPEAPRAGSRGARRAPPAQERRAATGRPPAGQAGDARRQGIVAPVVGPSNAARGCRRFLLRGLATIRGAWRLVGLTHHLRKMWRYGRGLRTVSAGWRPGDGLARARVRTPWR